MKVIINYYSSALYSTKHPSESFTFDDWKLPLPKKGDIIKIKPHYMEVKVIWFDPIDEYVKLLCVNA